MEIVRMAACHIPQIAALERLCFSEPWSEKSLSEEIENPAAYFIAAVENGAVLGYAGMHTVLGESYVDNIAVLPAHRGRGIGRALTAARSGMPGRAARSLRSRCAPRMCRRCRFTLRSASKRRACGGIFTRRRARTR